MVDDRGSAVAARPVHKSHMMYGVQDRLHPLATIYFQLPMCNSESPATRAYAYIKMC